jgi:hypothetical protein
MKLEKWALIAEIGSGVAIVVTLVVLIVETRANTDAIKIQTAEAAFSTSAQSFYYPEGNVALERAAEIGFSELKTDERAHAVALMASIFAMYDNNYYQYRRGTLDEEIHQAYRRRLAALMSVPLYRDRWTIMKGNSTEAFQRYVDEIIEELEE